MNPMLKEYVKRFSKQNNPTKKIEKFWTQLDNDEYLEKLPYLYNVENFCLRMTQAFLNNERICIYSDYDTDAVTATATMYWGLIDLGYKPENIGFYAPDRFTEGYGMNPQAVEKLSKEYALIVTVDCGINSTEEAEIIKNKKNCDLIITDHHHLTGDLPDCQGVINCRLVEDSNENNNNKQNENAQKLCKSILNKKIATISKSWLSNLEKTKSKGNYVSSSVTGVGVAWFSLLWLSYFWSELKNDPELKKDFANFKTTILNRTLALVAIGTIADCQSVLEPQNRLLIKSGIQILKFNQHKIPGLFELTKKTGLFDKITQDYNLTSQDLAFIYSPILNSSGRMTHADLSISCLVADDKHKAEKLATELILTNEERKKTVKEVIKEIDNEAANQKSKNSLIWLEGNWSKGIVGLIASRLVNKHDLPSVVISSENGTASASLRAPEGYHLPKAMKSVSEYFEKFGGHPGAAGFTSKQENLEKIKQKMEKELKNQISTISTNDIFYTTKKLPKNIEHLVKIKHLLWVESDEINDILLKEIWNLDPFGQDFPLPNLIFNLDEFSLKWLGNKKKHAKIKFGKQQNVTIFNIEEGDQKKLDKIFITKVTQKVSTNELWIEAKPSQNTWNGKTSNELIGEKIWFA